MRRRLSISALAALALALLTTGAVAAPTATRTTTAVPIDQLITLSVRWTPIDAHRGTVTVTFSGVPAGVNDGFLIMNATGAMDTSGWHDGSLLSRCPQNSCNYSDSVSIDWLADIHPSGSSGTYSFQASVPPGGTWYAEAYLQYRPTQSSPNHLATSSIVSFAAHGVTHTPTTPAPPTTTTAGGSNKAVQVSEGWALVSHNGRETKCTESNCPIDGFTVGDEITTGANSYILIKSKAYGTVRVGPNTKFTIAEHFADMEGGSIEYLQVQHQVPEHLYVAPLPALNYVGGKPKAYTAGVQAVQGANLDVFISTTSVSRTVRGVTSADAAKTVTIDVIRGAAKVSDQHGHTRVVKAGHEQQLVGGTLKTPTVYTQSSCALTAKGYGAFCGGSTPSNPSLPDGTIAPFKNTYFYCCWSGAHLKVAWASGGTALNMSWTNPGPRSPVSIIYIGSTILQPGIMWPGDLWRHYWDPLDPSVASFTLTRADFQSQPQATTWARLHQGGLYFQVSWECHIGYKDRQAGVTCDGPVTGQADVDLWSTLVKVPAG